MKPLRSLALPTGFLAMGLLAACTVAPTTTAMPPGIATLQPTPIALPEPSAALSATATQHAVATVVASKRQAATASVIEMTTSPLPPSIPPAEKIFDAQGPTQKAMLRLGLMVENIWAGNIHGRAVSVYAGAFTAHPDEGGILVWDDEQHGGRRLFSVPEAHGTVRILAENNGRLTLTSADKAVYYFDVPGLRLVSSLTQTVPTVEFLLLPTATSTVVTPAATPVATMYP